MTTGVAETPGRYFFHRTSPPALADFALDRLGGRCRSAVPDEPLADPAWTTVPSSYVVCADDRAVRPAAQRDRAALVGAVGRARHRPLARSSAARPPLAGFIAAQHDAAMAA